MLPKEFTEVPWSMDQEWKKCNKDTRTSFLKVFSYLTSIMQMTEQRILNELVRNESNYRQLLKNLIL